MPTDPTLSRGVAKIVTIAEETAWSVQASGPGQQLRRTQADFNLTTQQIESAEILPSQQARDSRQGPRQVQGTLSGQLSPSTYKMMMEGMLRSRFTAPFAASLNLSDATVTVDGTTGIATVNSAQNAFPAALVVGDTVRLTGAPQAIDNQIYCVIAYTQNTAGLAAVLAPAVAMGAGQAGELLSIPGKRLIMPATNQLDISFSVEQWYSDIGVSELFVGNKMTQLGINIPASGFATIQASMTGRNMLTGSSQVYGGALPATSTTGLTSSGGALGYKGQLLRYISSMSIQISSQVGADPAAGSNLVPGIFLGSLGVRGSITVFNAADTMTADFLNETELSLSALLTTGPGVSADFISLYMPRVKLTSSSKNDSDKAIMRSYSFVALENAGQFPKAPLSSIMIQDSTV